jgi:hypothetical protein
MILMQLYNPLDAVHVKSSGIKPRLRKGTQLRHVIKTSSTFGTFCLMEHLSCITCYRHVFLVSNHGQSVLDEPTYGAVLGCYLASEST